MQHGSWALLWLAMLLFSSVGAAFRAGFWAATFFAAGSWLSAHRIGFRKARKSGTAAKNINALTRQSFISTCLHSRAEDVFVFAIVITELEFGNVKRQILLGNIMESTDEPSLDHRPKRLNRIDVNRADNVLAALVIDERMREVLAEPAIAAMRIGAKQADLMRNCRAHEGAQALAGDAINDSSHYLTLAADSAHYNGLAGTTRAARRAGAPGTAALALVPVLGLAADICLIDLDNADQLAETLIGEAGPDPVAHVPSGLIAAKAQHPINLQGANAFLAGHHQMDNAEPVAERLVCILENGADQDGKAVRGIGGGASHALPVESHGAMLFDGHIATAGAANANGPAVLDQIFPTGILMREHGLELRYRQLVDPLLYFLGHGEVPYRV